MKFTLLLAMLSTTVMGLIFTSLVQVYWWFKGYKSRAGTLCVKMACAWLDIIKYWLYCLSRQRKCLMLLQDIYYFPLSVQLLMYCCHNWKWSHQQNCAIGWYCQTCKMHVYWPSYFLKFNWFPGLNVFGMGLKFNLFRCWEGVYICVVSIMCQGVLSWDTLKTGLGI